MTDADDDQPRNAVEKYLKDNDLTFRQLGDRAGVDGTSISRALRGKLNITLEFAAKIERATQGAIRGDEFMAICLAALQREAEAAAAAA